MKRTITYIDGGHTNVKCVLAHFNIALLNGLRVFDDYIFKAVVIFAS